MGTEDGRVGLSRSRGTCALIAALGAWAPAATHASALDTLVAAEHAFAALSQASGMKEAFLTYLTDDAVVFRPAPKNGRQIWRARESPPGMLAWAPDYVEISGDEDFGVTIGPWEYRPAKDVPPSLHGHFISVWRRMSDGAWRVVADIGVEHEQPAVGVDAVELVAGPAHPKPPQVLHEFGGPVFGPNLMQGVSFASGPGYVPIADRMRARAITAMMFAERDLVHITRNYGAERAYVAHAAEDVRVFRGGSLPMSGVADAISANVARGRRVELVAHGHGLATSRDMGYSYGLLIGRGSASAKPDTVSYLHVWRRDEDDRWRLAVDVENAFGRR